MGVEGDERFLAKRFIRDSSMVSRRISDELILVPITKKAGDISNLYTLNEVGARIWELMDGERPLHEVRDSLVAEFDVSPDVAAADIVEFVRHLEELGAITEARHGLPG